MMSAMRGASAALPIGESGKGFCPNSKRYVRCNRAIASAAAQRFDMAVASDESVADVIKQLEDLQLKVKSKKQQLKTMKKQQKKRSKSCESSSESSEDEDDSLDARLTVATLLRPVAPREEGLLWLSAPAAAVAAAAAAPAAAAAVRMEVCTGGKCKKNGSLELLAALRDSSACVSAVPCKCMNQCKRGPNVRVVDGLNEIVYNNVCSAEAGSLLQRQQLRNTNE